MEQDKNSKKNNANSAISQFSKPIDISTNKKSQIREPISRKLWTNLSRDMHVRVCQDISTAQPCSLIKAKAKYITKILKVLVSFQSEKS